MSTYQTIVGDCLDGMRAMADNSVDSIVTDPPYELGFMGKAWDASGIANNVDMWREALRVLKPGGHLLAFSGSRTYHRMTCAIEDAGFEVRDQIQWIYGSGFPKSNNLDKLRGTQTCGCMVQSTHDSTPDTGPDESSPTRATGEKPSPEHDLHDLLGSDVSAPLVATSRGGQVLQPLLPEQSAPSDRPAHGTGKHEGREQSRMEGRGDDVQAEGELQGHPVHSGAGSTAANGAGGRLHNGASGGDGTVVRVSADAIGSGAPRRPRSGKQSARQPGTVADEQRAQAPRAWPDCARCGLPVVPQGLGTALKPAHEPICVARKPLIGTVAANVLAHGTGALNIDGCRVDGGARPLMAHNGNANGRKSLGGGATTGAGCVGETVEGRWPANLIHDGSDEVLAAFPETQTNGNSAGTGNYDGTSKSTFGKYAARPAKGQATDKGSAARFFYCAKASKSDRGANSHPTVKPTALMAYLVRLVTPPGGLVLDPFMGSGSTGKACMREGFRFIGCELSAEYAAIAEARIFQEMCLAYARAR